METNTFYLTLIVAILTIVIIPIFILTVKGIISHELLKQDVENLKEEQEKILSIIDDLHEIKSNMRVIINHLELKV